MHFDTHKQFFTNEALIASMGFPSGLMDHDRHVSYSTKKENDEINKAAMNIKAMAVEYETNQWLKEKDNGTKG